MSSDAGCLVRGEEGFHITVTAVRPGRNEHTYWNDFADIDVSITEVVSQAQSTCMISRDFCIKCIAALAFAK